MLDIRKLHYFLAIAREEQITRAAKSLNMEQPPLSRQLKMMEEQLGVVLFDRNGKQMKLTEAGEVLQRNAKRLIDYLDETIQEVKDVEEGVRGTLSVGSVFSCVSLLPPKIDKFRQIYPEVNFKILEGDHMTLAEYLVNRTIDFGVTRLPFETIDPDLFSVKHLPSDPFVAVLPKTWASYQSKTSIKMIDLAEQPLLSLKSDRTVGLHEKIVNECRRFGFEPKITCECSSVAIIVALVVAGIGATILPKSVMTSFTLPEIQVLDIADTSFQSDVGVVWLKNRYFSKTAKAFINIFEEK